MKSWDSGSTRRRTQILTRWLPVSLFCLLAVLIGALRLLHNDSQRFKKWVSPALGNTGLHLYLDIPTDWVLIDAHQFSHGTGVMDGYQFSFVPRPMPKWLRFFIRPQDARGAINIDAVWSLTQDAQTEDFTTIDTEGSEPFLWRRVSSRDKSAGADVAYSGSNTETFYSTQAHIAKSVEIR